MCGLRLQPVARALETAGHAQTATRRLIHHLVDERQVWAGDLRPGEQVDKTLQIGATLTSRFRDHSQRLDSRLGRVRRQPLTSSRLHHHDTQRVADNVVQFAGNAGSLVAY